MSSAEEPLISRRPSEEGDRPDDDNDNDIGHDTVSYDNAAPTPASPTLFIYLFTFSAGISGLLFGCTSSPHVSPNLHH
jgi:SP family myo-inositol transporter-like MFS transporter 13